MEGSSTTLSTSDAAGQILLDGLIDWVHLGMVRQYVRNRHHDSSSAELRRLTIDIIAWMLEHDLVLVGDVWSDFAAWPSTAPESIARIEREWSAPDDPLRPGDVCWLSTTPAGDEIGWRLEAEQRARGA